MMRKRIAEPAEVVINGHTLVQVVGRYLAELANPVPDGVHRQMYRDWMREFVDVHKAREGGP